MSTYGDDNHNARRKFLTRSATLVAAGAALPVLPVLARLSGEDAASPVSLATAPPTAYRRVNAHGPNGSAALADLRAAVSAMLALPPEDPRNWYRQAMIHVLDCPHGNAWFFPWHRGYLYWFERIARSLLQKPNFALPYWDWTTAPDMPVDFFLGDQLDTDGPAFIQDFPTFDSKFRKPMEAFWAGLTPNRLKQLELRGYANFELFWAAMEAYFTRGVRRLLSMANRQLTGAALQAVSLPTAANALAPSDFFEFGGSLVAHHSDMTGVPGMVESQPHNLVHEGIEGFMGDMMSATDPVFWLHHANIDRLWDVWMQRKPDPYFLLHATPEAWRSEPFLFFRNDWGGQMDDYAVKFAQPIISYGIGHEETTPIPALLSRPANAAWPATTPCQLPSTDLAINGSVTAIVEPGAVACDAFVQSYPTAIVIDLDRPVDPSAWRFKFEIKIEGSSFSAKDCGYTGFFSTMDGMPGMQHPAKLKLGIADGMSQCLAEAGAGAQRLAVTVRAEPVGSTPPAEVLKVYDMTLISL
jgi:hypothetical protein